MTEHVTPAETPAAPTAPAAPAAPAPKSGPAELPDWARQQISSANAEAAQKRVELKAVKEERDALQEQVATLTAEKAQAAGSHTAVQSDFDKLATAVKALVPNPEHLFTFANTLQGDSDDALAAHADALKSMFGIPSGPAPAVDRSQGQGSGAPANDPAAQFAALLQSQLGK
ncbi:hypothetical protein [Mycolicibacterium houstonense]|uniref:hypothetical protein n=1 Tax=Mycolicibacterium houstonense TaxID=146021 RepID=UPI0008375DD8|nr:hypothetical protein [Mycolicibacterium houstonense]